MTRVRRAEPSDRAAIETVVRAAFAEEPVVATIVEDLHAAGRAEIELVAVDGDEVVGHVLLSRAWVDDETALAEVLVLSPLGVAPDRQGGGLGGALIAAALEAAREAGETHVFLEGDPGYYSRHGFAPALEHGFLRPTERIPGPAFQVAVLTQRPITGRLVYPDAFWAHDAAGLRGETLAQVRAIIGG